MTRRLSGRRARIAVVWVGVSLFVALFSARLQAEQVVRDAEIEEALQRYASPILSLEPDSSVRFHVLWSDDVNAFVSQGRHIFFTSGLLRFSESVSEIRAVIAHEFGHVLGDHYALTVSSYQKASRLAAIMAAASLPLIALHPQAAVASAIGVPQAIMNLTLAERRARETAADSSGARLIERAKLSGRGMLTFLQRLHSVPSQGYARYLQTHPSTQERVAFLARRLQASPYFTAPDSQDLQMRHARVRTKIEAYALEPRLVMRKYAEKNTLPAAYARAIAYHRSGQNQQALDEIQTLLEAHPQDPYFFEMRGNVLRSERDLGEASASYRTALRFVPSRHSVPISLLLFDTLLDIGDEASLAEARRVLELALVVEEDSISIRRRFARLYDRTGERGQRALMWAEAAWLSGERGRAFCSAQEALSLLDKSTTAYTRAKDIVRQVSSARKKPANLSCS